MVDIQYELHGTTFVWDADKAATNVRKHGVAFEQACTAFFDPLRGASMRSATARLATQSSDTTD